MIDNTDIALMDELPGSGEFAAFQPFRLNRLFHKGGDNKIEETEDEKAFADVVSQKWNHYRDTYSGLEKEYMSKVDRLDSEGSMDFAEGSANQHTQSAFSDAREKTRESHNKAGLNPNSGASKAKMAGLSSAEAESTGENVTRAGNSQQDEYITGVQNIVGMGQGKAAVATAGMGGLADSSADKAASDAQMAFNESAATQQAIGAVAGAATSYGLQDKKTSGGGYGMTEELPENQTAGIGLNYGQSVG